MHGSRSRSCCVEHGTSAIFYAQIVIQANMLSFADAQYAIGVWTFVLIPLIFVMPRRRKGAAPVPVSVEA